LNPTATEFVPKAQPPAVEGAAEELTFPEKATSMASGLVREPDVLEPPVARRRRKRTDCILKSTSAQVHDDETTPAETAPVEAAATEPVPAEATVTPESSPVEPTSAEPAPAEPVLADSTPAQPAPEAPLPAEATPAETALVEAAAIEPVPAEGTPAQPAPEDSVHIFVQSYAVKAYSLCVQASDGIGRVKAQIQDREGIRPDLQRLIYAGRELEDSCTIADYNIQTGSTLHI